MAALLPILALAVLELALRVGGYGFPTPFFLPLRIGDQPFLVENAAFGYRFFSREMAREPLELRLPVRKAEGTYRIFILGESAAMGDPEPAFGAGRYLEILLRERFPQTKFEVVNTAMTAINSHAILPIARECAGHEGDLWILYIGNNEMVGPFGAASAFGPKAPPLPLIRLYLAAQKTRVGQLALDLKRKLKPGVPAEIWAGMKMFVGNEVAPDAPARESVYLNFARNLSDIVQAGLGSGAKVILSTVAVNLKDSPPFASLHSENVSPADRAGCDTNFQAGLLAAQRDQPAEAAQDFERAAKCDPGMADVQYQWGEALLKLADPNAAGHFQKACDTDALPFRATAQINELIKSVGRRFAGPGLEVLDAVAALQTNVPAGLCGQETFYEHVHFNFDGNYRLARAWAGEVEKFLPAACRHGERSEWSSPTRCEELLGLNDWDRYNVATELVRRRQVPPLSSLPNNGPLLKALTDDAARLKSEMETITNRSQTRELYTAALRESPEDFYLHSNFAEFLTDIGETPSAIEQWQQVRKLYPQAYAAYYQLGRLAVNQRRYDQAKEFLEKTVAMRPSFSPGWFDLGSVHASTTNFDLAISAFDQAQHFDPQNSDYCFYGGLARAMLGRKAEAIAQYRQAVRLNPGNWKAHFELGGLLGQVGNYAEAKTESELAIRLNPSFPIAHLNLGLALTELGDLDGAEKQFEETLRLAPENPRAPDCLAQVRALKKSKK